MGFRIAIVLAAAFALAVACGGQRERVYYTPPTRPPSTPPTAAAFIPTAGPTNTPTLAPGDPGTPYPTVSGSDAAYSASRARQVCPPEDLDLCVRSFVIVDAGPGLGALCVREDGTFFYELSFFPAALPGVYFVVGSSVRPDQGTGVPCKTDRGATAVALVGKGG